MALYTVPKLPPVHDTQLAQEINDMPVRSQLRTHSPAPPSPGTDRPCLPSWLTRDLRWNKKKWTTAKQEISKTMAQAPLLLSNLGLPNHQQTRHDNSERAAELGEWKTQPDKQPKGRGMGEGGSERIRASELIIYHNITHPKSRRQIGAVTRGFRGRPSYRTTRTSFLGGVR